jgi:hypothetical protein
VVAEALARAREVDRLHGIVLHLGEHEAAPVCRRRDDRLAPRAVDASRHATDEQCSHRTRHACCAAASRSTTFEHAGEQKNPTPADVGAKNQPSGSWKNAALSSGQWYPGALALQASAAHV